MNPRLKVQLTLVQQHLKGPSFHFYLKVLGRLLSAHTAYSFLKPLSDALRERDFLKLYTAADSLSTQKYVDATEHFVANQFVLLIKKFPWPKDQLDLKPRDRAVQAFHASERRCGRMNRKIKLLEIDRSRDRFSKEGSKARYWIRTVIGSRPNYRSIFDQADFGSGASVGVHGDATNYPAKLSAESWTVTPGALHHGYAAIRRNYHMWELLLPRKGNLVCYDEEVAFANYLSRIRVVGENKISFVPKTAKTNRTIAVEPLLNGLVQKGIDQVLRKKLLQIGIDLRDQGLNQRMAREGSLDDSENGFVTIDLKSASDSISIELARSLIPDDWFRLFDRTRSKSYKLDKDVKVYEKLCSMGNGFCFPIETLIFASACFASGCGVPGVDFMVYGDDIIVRKQHASLVISLLNHWGFKVNTDKTFLEGPFRESCGADWFGGKDVRPFTLDYALDSLESMFKFLNLTRRSQICESFFESTRDHVVRHIPEHFQYFRPFKGEPDTGIDSVGSEFMTASSCRYLPRYLRWEWHELRSSPLVDYTTLELTRDEVSILISTALRGATSIGFGRYKGLPEVTLRNRTQTKVVRKGYVSTSNWLPPLSRI